ncbi:acyl-ACP--UDP-N-acetylglucosamine O-acyltransferase [Chromobacterium violaceum]|uniref:Acyl-[acyl-carrier-protein]--UDP-N-acetylglucosamine O-acyltransferase n=1 Tax=Chromobacterium violaceum TaxID=536 RepID=A0AAX2M8T7_CHRVL|nr:acyl-ACP--UDP-N-acetylglucosamine O-acyltransferase [Chromobacterium violaceum]OLZ78544.1 acyl-[acyl-carrier-protein]--UDP-N-acetylglucosamine O-acyltransferase [Chromobacterium violaceum]STB70582.1 Acyl-[acyl-carrier-protein]--UDP-N-acetylglucosamine O-acyltransferase [Chromobacterium violaceum]SUX32710.1 Acyl-[acyl-carrier-protein]--UDP-N-acetylglucosamine O-acyltransferase [Chromobacterium violaceum]
MAIHPTAIVDPKAQIADDVEIGAYSIIGPNVSIGAGSWIGPHVVIEGHTAIGKNNRVFQFCSLGAIPQDLKYAGEPTRLEIGDNNTIREFCTFNTGTVQDGGVTRVGSDNWIMAYVHIAHDCQVGNHIILANNATLAGHVHLGDWVFLGGFTSVHQFVIVGEHAMTAFASAVAQDIPAYVTAHGNRAVPSGINAEGMKRRGFTPEQIRRVRNAYKILYRQGLSYDEAKAAILAEAGEGHAELEPFVRFFGQSARGIIR